MSKRSQEEASIGVEEKEVSKEKKIKEDDAPKTVEDCKIFDYIERKKTVVSDDPEVNAILARKAEKTQRVRVRFDGSRKHVDFLVNDVREYVEALMNIRPSTKYLPVVGGTDTDDIYKDDYVDKQNREVYVSYVIPEDASNKEVYRNRDPSKDHAFLVRRHGSKNVEIIAAFPYEKGGLNIVNVDAYVFMGLGLFIFHGYGEFLVFDVATEKLLVEFANRRILDLSFWYDFDADSDDDDDDDDDKAEEEEKEGDDDQSK